MTFMISTHTDETLQNPYFFATVRLTDGDTGNGPEGMDSCQ